MLKFKGKQPILLSCSLGTFALGGEIKIKNTPPKLDVIVKEANQQDMAKLNDGGFSHLFEIIAKNARKPNHENTFSDTEFY